MKHDYNGTMRHGQGSEMKLNHVKYS